MQRNHQLRLVACAAIWLSIQAPASLAQASIAGTVEFVSGGASIME